MITTFFGAHSFGGDASYVDRLSRALLKRGHEVDVIYNRDAFEALRGDRLPRQYEPPAGLRVHGLRDPAGRLGLVWMHQTGRMGALGKEIEELLDKGNFDVIHFHNISLIGGPGVLDAGQSAKAVRLMTAHEHWLLCPLSLLWKKNREVCDRPSCVSCTLSAGRPPQFWRHTGLRDKMLARMDALIVPSLHTRDIHHHRGVPRGITHLPYFLSDEEGAQAASAPPWPATRPYFAAVGRLIKEKGFSRVIAQMRSIPEADLVIAGAGPFEQSLRVEAAGLSNVQFAGQLGYSDLLRLYKGARALIVPSLFHETFGYVVLEAFSAGTPAIVHNRGALPELVHESGAGDVYEDENQLLSLMKSYLTDSGKAASLGKKGRAAYEVRWSEPKHIEAYLQLIETGNAG